MAALKKLHCGAYWSEEWPVRTAHVRFGQLAECQDGPALQTLLPGAEMAALSPKQTIQAMADHCPASLIDRGIHANRKEAIRASTNSDTECFNGSFKLSARPNMSTNPNTAEWMATASWRAALGSPSRWAANAP